MKKPTGIILYEGASVLDGAPIVVVATLGSKNEKTGNMIQTWIMRTDVNPVEASKQALDASVCGGCVHRHAVGGACYVNIGQAPLSVWKAFHRGIYARASEIGLDDFIGRFVRFGSYGDPAAVPAEVWAAVAKVALGNTGYTHQMGHRNFDPRILDFCMVSADTPKQALAAHGKGLRTFRVKVVGAPSLAGEIECPSEKGVKCADCRACAGASVDGTSIVIDVHGSRSKRYTEKYERINFA